MKIFNKKTWMDRVVEKVGGRIIEFVDGNQEPVTIYRNEGTILEEGDLLNASSFNDLENRIESAFDTVDNSISELSVNPDWDSTEGHSEILNKPASLPASDVYDWAKKPSKPKYTASEVGADKSGSADIALSDAKSYTDKKVADHANDLTIHITDGERDNWNSAKAHSDLEHARSDAAKVESSDINGNIKINDTETQIYLHPDYDAVSAGLYKIGRDSTGHVSALESVTKEDITALGIPGEMPDAYVLPTASSTTLGGVKTSSVITSAEGYAACPILDGIPYYRDTAYQKSLFHLGTDMGYDENTWYPIMFAFTDQISPIHFDLKYYLDGTTYSEASWSRDKNGIYATLDFSLFPPNNSYEHVNGELRYTKNTSRLLIYDYDFDGFDENPLGVSAVQMKHHSYIFLWVRGGGNYSLYHNAVGFSPMISGSICETENTISCDDLAFDIAPLSSNPCIDSTGKGIKENENGTLPTVDIRLIGNYPL